MASISLKTAIKYENMLASKSKVWRKQEIQALCKALNNRNWSKNQDAKSALDDVQYAAINLNEVRITQEQTKIGIDWLRSSFIGKHGQALALLKKAIERQESHFPGHSEDEAKEIILSIVKSFSKFRFVGLYIDRNPYSGHEWHYPIYRTYSRDGSYFDYVPLHWAAPIIVDVYQSVLASKKGA